MSNQPAISNDRGAILTVGLIVGSDRVAIVEPYGIDQTAPDLSSLCLDLVGSWIAQGQTAFLDCVSGDASIVFISADGMQDGTIPYRIDFPVGSFPGTRPGGALSNNVTGMVTYYKDPADITIPNRMRVAKTFMPAVPLNNVTNDIIDTTLHTKYLTYGQLVQVGYASSLYSGKKWYRMLSVPKPRATVQPILRTLTVSPRFYVCTQRRRMVPR